MRTLRFSKAEFDASKKIEEDETGVVVSAVLTRESILPFEDGRGYKPAAELEDAAFTLEGAWVVPYAHIDTVFVTDKRAICGQVKNVAFCSSINGVTGQVRLFKNKCDSAFLESIKQGTVKDVSVAYFCEDIYEPGTFAGEPYDFVQRNFMFGHVAVGVAEGRCPSPFCGMAVDALVLKAHADPEETEEHVHVPVRSADQFVDGSFRTVTLSEEEGVRAVVGKLKNSGEGAGTRVQKYIFDKKKGWTLAKAQAWVNHHKDEQKNAEHSQERADGKVAAEALVDACELDPWLVLRRSRELLGSR